MLLIESGLALVALALAFVKPDIGSHLFDSIEAKFAVLAHRQHLAVLTVFMATIALRAALLPVFPLPEPVIHDEFSYLLASDTLAHGRATNPPHPMWTHFESFGIIQKPTYQSVAQPAQGMVLAAGQLLAGHPFWGVMFSAALMCAAICWMLQAWISPGWALIGGAIAILRFGTFGYWADSYWGGAIGAAGGALVLGALPRIKRYTQARHAVIMAIGLAMLANNRPYEGLLFSIPIGIALFGRMLGKNRPPFRRSMRRVIAPIVVVLSITALAMSYYCWRVTGHPLSMPYQVERKTYAASPFFVWQKLPIAPIYRHAVMQRMYVEEELLSYKLSRTVLGPALKAFSIWSFYWGPILFASILVMLLVLPYGFSWRDISNRTRFLLALLLIMYLAVALESFFSPHYASPFTCVLLALPLLAMGRIRVWSWRDKPSGHFLVRSIVLTCVIMFVLRIAAVPLHLPIGQYYAPAWYQRGPDSFGRAALENRLQQTPGRHLVIVHYAPDHEPFEEWVYNEANIDASKVVWARDMGTSGNQELINYFQGRRVWLLEPDKDRHALVLYPSRPAVSSAAMQETP